MHRADFQQILFKNLPKSCSVHLRKKLVSYVDIPSGAIILHFEDGSTAECDALVGADGIKSAVRHTFFRNINDQNSHDRTPTPTPVWSGTVAYRSLIPKEVLEKCEPDHRVFKRAIMVSACRRHLSLIKSYADMSISIAERTR